MIRDFYGPFQGKVASVQETLESVKGVMDEKTDVVCDVCGRPMVKKLGRFGFFLACTGFPACRTTRPVPLADCPREGCKGKIVARRKQGGGVPTSPLAHVRVRDPETGALLGPGQPGALECAGPSLMMGYYGNPDATAQAMTADGYVRTGDLAQLDGRGGFTFLSRMGDVLRLSGFLVNPLEIETHIQKMPGIAACQTIALPRPDGVRPVAFVILHPGATLDEAAVIAHCRQGLAGYKVPIRTFAIDEFPRTPSPNGLKIQRNRLREMADDLMRSPSP